MPHMVHPQHRRRFARTLACALMLTPLLATPARAQWPDDRVVRIVVPFAPAARRTSWGGRWRPSWASA